MLTKGTRVEIHPATDHWMRGDRYGTVVGYGRAREFATSGAGERFMARPVRIKLDKSGKVVRFHDDCVYVID